MRKSIKKLLPIIAGINGLLGTNLWGEPALLLEKEQAAPLLESEKSDVESMKKELDSITKPHGEKVGEELLKEDLNVRGDAQNPYKFKPTVKVELKRVKFSTEHLRTAHKCVQIKLEIVAKTPEATTTVAKTEDKKTQWTEPCKVEVSVGYENLLPDGKMLLFESGCTCATLPTDTEKSVPFYISGDVRQKHGLPGAPDFFALRFTTDGIRQPTIIANKEGKDTYRSDGDIVLNETRKRSRIESRIMRNFDQMSVYNLPSDVIKNTPSLLLEVDA
jgi:hypothetical protein